MASFTDSFDQIGIDSQQPASLTRPLDDDGYLVYDPRSSSRRLDSLPNFSESESVRESVDDSLNFNNGGSNSTFDSGNGVFEFDQSLDKPVGDEFSTFSPEPIAASDAVNGVFVVTGGPVLPPPSEMPEEGFALSEWRRQNAIHLEQKEKKEKELLGQIINVAIEYKAAFHEKRRATCDNNKASNREKEKLFLANHEKFHKEADKGYWKAIAELIPNEVPAIEKKGKKDQGKEPSIVILQGPKPGKLTDLSRLRHIHLKLKHEAPPHLKLCWPSASPAEDAKASSTAPNSSNTAAAVAASTEAVVVA
ncbi:hypothetical protein Nepgr_032404 [Nepenthes gracilis]|uniref:Clathrin light chain n=1 Tax=Nepenthes gracilis TaxID=150966 RepID=A0AAD3TK82_NEPGR|nr:hypothetical protein Nepgr_032404 [Nepenthes gracilis]